MIIKTEQKRPGDDKILMSSDSTERNCITMPYTGNNNAPQKPWQPRDFEAEALGKTICAAYAAALQSPGLPTYAMNKEEYLKLVEEVTDRMVVKVFSNRK